MSFLRTFTGESLTAIKGVQPAQPSKADRHQEKTKAKGKKGSSSTTEVPSVIEDPFCKAVLQVGTVVSVTEFESDKLYCCLVATGNAEPKQVIAGLKNHMAADELQGRSVCLIINLKPAKLAGKVSEAMILAAVAAKPDGSELVHPIQPPDGCSPGDAVYADGLDCRSAPPKTLKSEIWRGIAAQLKAIDGIAHYAEYKLMTASGPVQTHARIPDNSPIR